MNAFNVNMNDAMQSHLDFVLSQTTEVESTVYRIQYPEVDFQDIVPVVTSANPWVKSVTYMSIDGRGKAKWINGNGKDMPVVGISMDKFETQVHTAGIGYSYGYEDVNQAAMLGISLSSEEAVYANRAYREMLYDIAMEGDTEKGFEGLYNNSDVPDLTIPADGTGSSALWSTKTPDQIIRDLNAMITGVFNNTNTVGMADTLLMSHERFQYLASTRMTDSQTTIMEFFMRTNVYTAMTGRRLDVRGRRGLSTAGAGGTQRMISYRRSPEVLKMHLPMPHRFLPVQIEGLQYTVPGIFRVGGLDVRLPQEMLYGDGI